MSYSTFILSLLFNNNLLFQPDSSFFILLLPPIFKLSKLMGIWIILMHVFDHQSCWAPKNILNHFFGTALANPCKFSFHPFCMRLIQIWQLQKWIPPFRFHPRPNSFNRIEIRWARRQIFRSAPLFSKKSWIFSLQCALWLSITITLSSSYSLFLYLL